MYTNFGSFVQSVTIITLSDQTNIVNMHEAVSFSFTQVYKKRVQTCMHKKCMCLFGNVPIMSLNLCRRNLEDQFLFPTCQGPLHALLPPGLRSSLSPMVDVGDCIRLLFLFRILSSLSFGFYFSFVMSPTIEASNPSWGNSASSRRWSSSRCRIFPRVCSTSSLVPKF